MKQESINKLQRKFIDTLKKYGDKKVIASGSKTWSGNEFAKEIEDETEFGLLHLEMIVNLAINLLSRDKINLQENEI